MKNDDWPTEVAGRFMSSLMMAYEGNVSRMIEARMDLVEAQKEAAKLNRQLIEARGVVLRLYQQMALIQRVSPNGFQATILADTRKWLSQFGPPPMEPEEGPLGHAPEETGWRAVRTPAAPSPPQAELASPPSITISAADKAIMDEVLSAARDALARGDKKGWMP